MIRRGLPVVLVLAALLGREARADFRTLVAPGKLARAHAPIEGRCDACHVPFKGIPDSACLACHEKTAARIERGRGTHAAFAKSGKKCTACHTDHKGADHPLSPPVAEPFDHGEQSTGFALNGAHARVPCASCHGKTAAGSTRWTGLARDCAGCHHDRDPHAGTLGRLCEACHTESAWKAVKHSRGEHRVPMGGGHAALDCIRCHSSGAHLSSKWSCGDCHSQPHGGTRAPCATCHVTEGWKKATFTHDFCTCILPGKHQTAPCLGCHPAYKFNPTPMDCAGCHKKDLKHEDLGACARCHSALSFKVKAFDHDKPSVGFKLEGHHLEVGCENCHTKKGVFRGAPKKCEGCHEVPVHGDFGACARCHTTGGWDPPKFSHDATGFKLEGAHAKQLCQDCHGKFKKGQYAPGPRSCTLCHADPHGARVGPSRTCVDCHSFQSWKPSTIDAASHAVFGYTLEGEHQKVRCASCHAEGRLAGTPLDCQSCHLDRHGGRFGPDCARCHDESGWKHHPRFDHEVETKFALAGAHAGRPCASCHGPDGAALRSRAPVGCATCHATTSARGHGEQFGPDCTACHKPTRFNDVPAFDHRRTLFPLERRHLVINCTACHGAARGAGRLPSDCRACHGDPHRGRTSLDCADCHRPDDWTRVRYDHDRSEFRLNGRHFLTPCRDCHVGDVYSGLRRECVFCHRGERVRADQKLPGHRNNSFDCGDCHRAFGW